MPFENSLIRRVCIAEEHLIHFSEAKITTSTVSILDAEWVYCCAGMALAGHKWATFGEGVTMADAARFAGQRAKARFPLP